MAFKYFIQLCSALDYVHRKGYVHRDIKLENVLLDQKGNVKLCDFGWATPQGDDLTLFCGTLDYMAPELLGLVNRVAPYTQAVDMWALGVLLFELLHGHPPFPGEDPQAKTKSIHQQQLVFGKDLSLDCQHLIFSLLTVSPKDRMTFPQLFGHSWVRQ